MSSSRSPSWAGSRSSARTSDGRRRSARRASQWLARLVTRARSRERSTQLAGVAAAQHDHARARQLSEEALALRRWLGDPLLIANAAYNLGAAALREGDLARAGSALGECLRIARDLGDTIHTAAALCALGEVALERGKGSLGGAAAASGDAATAARLWGAAEALRARLGASLVPAELSVDARYVALVVERLGEEEFSVLRGEGRGLGPRHVLGA